MFNTELNRLYAPLLLASLAFLATQRPQGSGVLFNLKATENVFLFALFAVLGALCGANMVSEASQNTCPKYDAKTFIFVLALPVR